MSLASSAVELVLWVSSLGLLERLGRASTRPEIAIHVRFSRDRTVEESLGEDRGSEWRILVQNQEIVPRTEPITLRIYSTGWNPAGKEQREAAMLFAGPGVGLGTDPEIRWDGDVLVLYAPRGIGAYTTLTLVVRTEQSCAQLRVWYVEPRPIAPWSPSKAELVATRSHPAGAEFGRPLSINHVVTALLALAFPAFKLWGSVVDRLLVEVPFTRDELWAFAHDQGKPNIYAALVATPPAFVVLWALAAYVALRPRSRPLSAGYVGADLGDKARGTPIKRALLWPPVKDKPASSDKKAQG